MSAALRTFAHCSYSNRLFPFDGDRTSFIPDPHSAVFLDLFDELVRRARCYLLGRPKGSLDRRAQA